MCAPSAMLVCKSNRKKAVLVLDFLEDQREF
jgi:hypothetical protein